MNKKINCLASKENKDDYSFGELKWRRKMKPLIEKTQFGSITIDGTIFKNDIIVRLDGEVKKRKKKLSKAVYGSSHTISLEEAKYIYEKNAEEFIMGTGQHGLTELSKEASDYFKKKNCKVRLFPTPEAIRVWNRESRKTIGLFHVTC